MLVDEPGQPIDQPRIVRRDVQQPAGTLRIVGQQAAGERVEVLVDVGLLRIGDRRLLEIGAFDEADGGSQRKQRLDVLRRPIEVRLERDSDPMRSGARSREQVDRRIDVGRAFHVDPDEAVALGRAIDQPLQVLEAQFLVQIEAELRRLHRHLRPQPRGFHLVDHGQIVLSHLLRLVHAREVLAELRKDGADALPLLLLRRRHRIVEPFARHECRDGATDEGGPRRPLAKPAVGGER